MKEYEKKKDKKSANEERRRKGKKEEGEWVGAGEAPLVLISRNAELGDVSDFGGQTPPGARRGHVCFSPLRLSL